MAYQNPVPHLGGKKFNVNMTFDFEDWTDIEDAKLSIEEYIEKTVFQQDVFAI